MLLMTNIHDRVYSWVLFVESKNSALSTVRASCTLFERVDERTAKTKKPPSYSINPFHQDRFVSALVLSCDE